MAGAMGAGGSGEAGGGGGGGADQATGETVLVTIDAEARVATITLNRPDALNALTVPMKVALLGAFRRVERDAGVRAVILTGAGRAFCAGQDLRERLQPDAAPLGVEVRERYNPIIRAMRGLSKPIVGAINGVAAGAGASLAMACDIRIASEAASFALAFGRVGLVPDSGATWFLPRLVGATRAAELALLGDPVPAADAVRLGLVGRVVPADQLESEARSVAGRLAAGAPRAMALTKRALNATWDRDLDAALEYEAHLQDMAGRSRDHAEGLAAFLEKRPPRFTGE
jgi:2-(1,2-epoxy-1,2-dihydrophenyl)acetyl-CoA isomerase